MDLKINDKLFGFTCVNIRKCAEANGQLVELVHDETGAQICWADNGESNKLFSVAFKTIPSDNTGVFHILEHSVLCGSDKYPVKEPFVELLKSSMNTFLNAMTFPDKTLYPVSSRNVRDYLNLMNVYLDAVFSPMILKNPNIFYQEGRRIERDGEELRFNGVVFNEMKGAMAGADESIEQKLLTILYPDSCYGFNSGGDPESIPDLTYEQFIETYHRFYHPSNARFYLDGDIPLEETLKAIDSSIRGRGRRTDIPEIQMQKATGSCCEFKYEINGNESKTDHTRLEIAKILGTWRDAAQSMAVNVLADVMAGSNESVLTRAVLEAGLAQDVDMDIEAGIAQPYVALSFKNIPDGKVEELRGLVRAVAEKLVKEGIDKKALRASLNLCEFRMREPKEPAALLRCMNAFNTWLYGGDPLDGIAYEDKLKALRDMIEGDGFEKLVETIFLDPNGVCTLVSVPEYGLSSEKDKIERERLKKIAEDMSEADRNANDQLLERFNAWQMTPDSEAALATLPVLNISEVDPEPEIMNTSVSCVNGVKMLYHQVPGNGIVNISLYFKLTDRSYEELPKLSMLENLLGVLGTENYSALQLEEQLKNDVGRITFAIKVMGCRDDNSLCIPMLAVRCSVLESNIEKAEALLEEILLRTDFSDEDRTREILLQLNDYNREIGSTAGHTIARACTMAHYGADLAAVEAITGYTASHWLRQAAENEESSVHDICEYLKELKGQLFTSSRLTVSVAASQPVDLSRLISVFPEGKPVPAYVSYKTALPERLGIRIPNQIGFSAQAMHTRDYCGSLRVATNILSLDYLWNAVRVRGGAYGTGMNAGRCGLISTYSYRDPSPLNALEANRDAARYLRNFAEEKKDIDKFIISAVANTEPLISPAKQAMLADDDYLEGYDDEYKRRVRREMLDTDWDKLLECAETVETMAKTGDICIVAGDALLKTVEGLTVVDW